MSMTDEEVAEFDTAAAQVFVLMVNGRGGWKDQPALAGPARTGILGAIKVAGFQPYEVAEIRSANTSVYDKTCSSVVLTGDGTVDAPATKWLEESVRYVINTPNDEAHVGMVRRIVAQRTLLNSGNDQTVEE